MTNYEKHKIFIIDMLVANPQTCEMLWRLRENKPGNYECPIFGLDSSIAEDVCKMCEKETKKWLYREAKTEDLSFDWSKVRVGDTVSGLLKGTETEREFTVLGKEEDFLWVRYEEFYTVPYRTLDNGYVGKIKMEEKNGIVAIKTIEEKMCEFKIENAGKIRCSEGECDGR